MIQRSPETWVCTGKETTHYLALVDGKWVVLRVPFPMSFFAMGLEGHIDNPDVGWKTARRVDTEGGRYRSCAANSSGMVAKPSGKRRE
jgi:hypothetical protein